MDFKLRVRSLWSQSGACLAGLSSRGRPSARFFSLLRLLQPPRCGPGTYAAPVPCDRRGMSRRVGSRFHRAMCRAPETESSRRPASHPARLRPLRALRQKGNLQTPVDRRGEDLPLFLRPLHSARVHPVRARLPPPLPPWLFHRAWRAQFRSRRRPP